MPNNFIREGNLDGDAVLDEGTSKVRFENVLTGEGDPVADPDAPLKAWIYADMTQDPAVLWVWDPTAESWNPAGVSGSHDVVLIVQLPDDDLTTGDDQYRFVVPEALDGFNVTDVHSAVAGAASTSGLPAVQVARLRGGVAVDVLSTLSTIDEDEFTSYTAVSQAVVNASNDDLATGDILRVDVDAAGTGAQGLQVIVSVGLP